MQIVIPMAGIGKRFLDAGYKTPKPFLMVEGATMIEHVFNLYPANGNFLLICNNSHLKMRSVKKILNNIKGNKTIVGIDNHELGPVHTILKAESFIKDNEPVIVNYSDFMMLWEFKDFMSKVANPEVASVSVCYKNFHPHLLRNNLYAGVKVNDSMQAIEVREKYSFTENLMDTWQQAGTFYFKTGKLLKDYSRQVIAKGIAHAGEHYVSHLFNLLIKDGLKSLVYPIDYFCQWGTPEDLESYEAWLRLFSGKAGTKKGITDIPATREKNVKIDSVPESKEYQMIKSYWENYFKKSK